MNAEVRGVERKHVKCNLTARASFQKLKKNSTEAVKNARKLPYRNYPRTVVTLNPDPELICSGPKLVFVVISKQANTMKTLISLLLTAFFLASCTFYDVEPRYDSRDRIVGRYEVEEYSETYDDFTYYDLRVSKSGYEREIYFNNFYGADLRIHAYLDSDRITIPFQVVDGYEVRGNGTVFGNEINLSYSVKDIYNNTRTDYCETQLWLEY